MSRPANPFNNAKAESFLKSLKTEELNAHSFKTINDARSRIDDVIANIQNSERLHSVLGYPPLEFETACVKKQTHVNLTKTTTATELACLSDDVQSSNPGVTQSDFFNLYPQKESPLSH